MEQRRTAGNESAFNEGARLGTINNKGTTQVFNDLSYPLAD